VNDSPKILFQKNPKFEYSKLYRNIRSVEKSVHNCGLKREKQVNIAIRRLLELMLTQKDPT